MLERILVVDDEEVNQLLLEAVLAHEGYHVELASDGPAALEKIAAHPPDLVLLDLVMPGMSGIELCQLLKQDSQTAAIPIIIVTAEGRGLTREAALACGADDFVTKPVRPDDLRTRVGAILRVRQVSGELARTMDYLEELEAARHAQRCAALARIAAEEGQGADRQPSPVLLVDDDPVVLASLGDALSERGFDVAACESGRDALRLIALRSVEAAVVDIVMPDLSGFEVLERLQAADPGFPVILMSGHPGSLYLAPALESGAFAFITKSSDPTELTLILRRAVRHRREALSRARELARLDTRVRELEAREVERCSARPSGASPTLAPPGAREGAA
jgi:two-component system, cell cycle response regulator